MTSPVEPAHGMNAQGLPGTEMRWRTPVDMDGTPALGDGNVIVSRWKRDDADVVEFASQAGNDFHTVGINLKSTRVTFHHNARPIHSGCVMPGATQVTSPGTPVRAVFHSSCDVLHLYITQSMLAECYEGAFGNRPVGDIVLSDPSVVHDPVLERLGVALSNAAGSCGAFGRVYADSIGLAIVSRLLSREFSGAQQAAVAKSAGLPAWRMKRVVDYIEAHLTKPIGLADVAQSAGLSRMHFAAQFRAATGLRPHEFVLRRRIEHAQALLLQRGVTSLEVALDSGFRSQAHFTTVFKRLVGETPARWRTDARGQA